MRHYLLKDIAKEISIRENNPSSSKYDKFVGLEHYESGEIEIHKYGKTDNLVSAMKVFQSGDILVARRNVYLKRASRVNFSGLTSGDSIILRANNSIYEKILPFILNTENFWEYADKYSDGTMSKRLSPKTLLQYEFDLPETTELEKLIKILWAAEETKQAYKKLLQKTDDMVKAKFEEMFGDINKLSDKNKKTIKEFVDIRDDLRKPLNDATRAEMKSGILYPYYGAIGCVDFINDYKMDCDAICITEDCGNYKAGEDSSYIISGKSWVNNHAHILIPNQDNCLIKFLNFYFKIMDLTKFISGSTRSKLTRGVLEQLPIYLPPLKEQALFIKILETAEQSKQQLQTSLDSLNATMRALINENLK